MTYISQYPPAFTSTYIKTNAEFSGHEAVSAWNTATPLTGSWTPNNGWLTDSYDKLMTVDLGIPKIIKRIYYEGAHDGGYPGSGYVGHAKEFTFWGSNSPTAFADTDYTHDTDWVQITTAASDLEEHIAADVADPKYMLVTNSTAYRYYRIKIHNAYPDAFSAYIGLRRIELQADATPHATGGIITMAGDDYVHTFLSSGAFEVLDSNLVNVRVLLIGGGGAGGLGLGAQGGGGAGGYLHNPSFAVSMQSYAVTVGNGGAVAGDNGQDSVFDTLTALGGGHGGNYEGGAGGDGGSGGGGAGSYSLPLPAGGIGSQGFNGGIGTTSNAPQAGGGAGAGEDGWSAGVGGHALGDGGNGLQNDISGVLTWYAGGGGGGDWNSGLTIGLGGLGGGGGPGGGGGYAPEAGEPNTGGGGSGTVYAGASLGGGSGIVIIRYSTPTVTSIKKLLGVEYDTVKTVSGISVATIKKIGGVA